MQSASPISVIIPTYKEPEYLDLCLESAHLTESNSNEYVVCCDGTYDINKPVIEKWKGKLDIAVFDMGANYGIMATTNTAVYNSTGRLLLFINDDNVFSSEWDTILLSNFEDGYVISPNQVEPIPSIFKSFHCKDFGQTRDTFDLHKWIEGEKSLRKSGFSIDGETYPFLINRQDYLRVGGYDIGFPNGYVADWDLFLRMELCGLKFRRSWECNFYHFVSKSITDPAVKMQMEMESHAYFEWKWGSVAKSNPHTNSKLLS